MWRKHSETCVQEDPFRCHLEADSPALDNFFQQNGQRGSSTEGLGRQQPYRICSHGLLTTNDVNLSKSGRQAQQISVIRAFSYTCWLICADFAEWATNEARRGGMQSTKTWMTLLWSPFWDHPILSLASHGPYLRFRSSSNSCQGLDFYTHIPAFSEKVTF